VATKKIVLIDRDGVINRDREDDYVRHPEQLEVLPAALQGIKKLTDAGCRISIVSNQAGIAKGLYTSPMLDRITTKMLQAIEVAGGKIASVHYCPHQTADDCACRKPKTGLLEQAVPAHVDRSAVYLVGDSERDVTAGKRFGCRTILVLSGKTKTAAEVQAFVSQPDFVAADLRDAAERIILAPA